MAKRKNPRGPRLDVNDVTAETPWGVYRKTSDGWVFLMATENETYDWAHRRGNVWPVSQLSEHEVNATIGPNGDLIDLEVEGGEDVSSAEFSAWSSDVIAEAEKTRHRNPPKRKAGKSQHWMYFEDDGGYRYAIETDEYLRKQYWEYVGARITAPDGDTWVETIPVEKLSNANMRVVMKGGGDVIAEAEKTRHPSTPKITRRNPGAATDAKGNVLETYDVVKLPKGFRTAMGPATEGKVVAIHLDQDGPANVQVEIVGKRYPYNFAADTLTLIR